MKAKRIDISDEGLLDLDLPAYSGGQKFQMFPAPVEITEELSPFLAIGNGHGAVKEIEASALHNGRMIAIRIKWLSDRHDKIVDLDSFVDGVACLFPLARGTVAVTMGSKGKPANAWYWKANTKEPFEVIAEGYHSVRRVKGFPSDLQLVSRHRDGEWIVIFRRSFSSNRQLVSFAAGKSSKVAFAVWNGGNAERSGRKAFSGDFVDLDLSV